MSLVSAILFKAPPPIFHGSMRKIMADEMLTDAKGNAIKKSYYGMSGSEISKLIRKNIIAELESGKTYTAADLSEEIDASISATRIHLVALAEIGLVKIEKIIIRGVRAYAYTKAP